MSFKASGLKALSFVNMVSDSFSFGSQAGYWVGKKKGCSIFQRFPVFIIVRPWFIKSVLLLQADQDFLCATEAKIDEVCARRLWMGHGYRTQATVLFRAAYSPLTQDCQEALESHFFPITEFPNVTFKRNYCSYWVLSYRIWKHIIYVSALIDGRCWRNCMFSYLSVFLTVPLHAENSTGRPGQRRLWTIKSSVIYF